MREINSKSDKQKAPAQGGPAQGVQQGMDAVNSGDGQAGRRFLHFLTSTHAHFAPAAASGMFLAVRKEGVQDIRKENRTQ
jgi:hypothetical protein